MKKLILLIVLLPSLVYGQEQERSPRFVLSEPFSTAQEAVDYANALPSLQRFTVQFVTEFDTALPTPAYYRVISDTVFWSNRFISIGGWEYQDRLELIQAVEYINSIYEKFNDQRRRVNFRAQFIGYWHPVLNPYATTTTVFYMPDLTGKCEYELIERDLGDPVSALSYSRSNLRNRSNVDFSMQFNVGNSIYGSLWLIASDCRYSSGNKAGLWRLVENDEEGNSFTLETATQFAQEEGYRFVKFVSFTSPSNRNARSRILIFFKN